MAFNSSPRKVKRGVLVPWHAVGDGKQLGRDERMGETRAVAGLWLRAPELSIRKGLAPLCVRAASSVDAQVTVAVLDAGPASSA